MFRGVDELLLIRPNVVGDVMVSDGPLIATARS
jgi:hypothetical protein